MTTAFQTGPGLFAADSASHDTAIAAGKIRVYCVRVEAYDLDQREQSDLDMEFEILFAKAEKNPQIAKALLKLKEAISLNEPLLKGIVLKS
jgi:hypothetical protein